MAINATEQPLGKVFTADYRFRIPSFQRAYIWKPEQILQLVSDLDEACKSPAVPYFLGSLILVRESDAGEYAVIDGQQRLVSLSIIIAALRDLEQDPEWMRLLDALIVEPGDKLRGIRNEPRLVLRDRDAAFFREYVQEGNLEALFDLSDDDLSSAAQHNIMVNTRQTYDALARFTDDERRRFASYLVNGVTLVIVTTDDLDGAHRIFDVMNMRGLPLTPSDVFKARAMSGLRPVELDAYATRWDDIMDPLGDDARATEEFFAALHMILTHKPATGKLIEDFLTDVLQAHVAGGTVPAFIDRVLAPYATAWRILDKPGDTVLAEGLRDRIELLNDYRNREWKPVAMWALVHSFRNLGQPGLSPFVQRGSHTRRDAVDESALGLHDRQRLDELFAALERLTGIDTLNRTGALERRGHAAAAIRDLDKGYPVRLVRGLSVKPDDRTGALIRLHGEMQGDDDLVRLLLVRANEQAASGRIARPRRLSALPIVPLDIADETSFAQWTQDEHDYWMYRLGNMALVQGSADQLDRIGDYRQRRERMLLRPDSKRFPLTQQLADFTACTPAMIRHRQEETIRLLADYWDIRYDERHVDLTAQDIEGLAAGEGGGAAATRAGRGSRRVTIAQVVKAGLLIPGETLVWERPRKGERWVATVTDNGRFRLEDGSEYASPTAAARAAGGRSGGGLDVWKRVSDGRKLSDIWQEYRLRR
ncbi:hypothetical protein DSM100688_0250 [Bifidobacterium ramosum]|uniref:DUF262 domain-containing protein n=1 Tax=Bifidobacterium ramosum TaxID=1798158 RepID=A0A6L4X2N1_9BIFI|nr:DUF262 domain-containing protein [Bifidobacterium ramosum]KAB8289170.1 hypothetical protein DSM100688_0250 [Bifidobacterium ramosum]NEG70879.1 DUF262 domain-containing protein [Bifidobacterium ramosum]